MVKIVLLALLVCISATTEAQQVPRNGNGFQPLSYPTNEIQGDGAESCLNEQQRETTLNTISSNIHTLIEESVLPFISADSTLTPCMTGGRLVAYINMTKKTHECPGKWREITSPKRACVRGTIGDCDSVFFPTGGISYTRICGRVTSYQYCTTDAFYNYNADRTHTIDDVYVDGVSITHGENPREHIWTFAAAYFEEYTGTTPSICPCTNSNNPNAANILIPPFVGSDYFCDTGTRSRPSSACGNDTFYTGNPLWDGQGCGANSSCCQLNNPPWFHKTLPQPTTDEIEVRICGSNTPNNEEAPIEVIELYVG